MELCITHGSIFFEAKTEAALAGVRVKKVQKVQKVQRVKVGACGASMNKTFTTGLRPWENRDTPFRA